MFLFSTRILDCVPRCKITLQKFILIILRNSRNIGHFVILNVIECFALDSAAKNLNTARPTHLGFQLRETENIYLHK